MSYSVALAGQELTQVCLNLQSAEIKGLLPHLAWYVKVLNKTTTSQDSARLLQRHLTDILGVVPSNPPSCEL